MNNLTKIASAWTAMWTLSYFAVAALAPNVGGDTPLIGIFTFGLFGVLLVVAMALSLFGYNLWQRAGQVLLWGCAGVSMISGVASWTGVAIWQVPFASKEVFQVTMAAMDFIGAFFMTLLAISVERRP